MLDARLKQLYQRIDTLEKEERWTELAAVYESCIEISLEIYGENHDETLALYSEYGGLLRNLGRYEEALEVLKRALRIAKITKGKTHPDYASALVNLANLFRQMKYQVESQQVFLEAKDIYEKIGQDHSVQYAGLCNNLGLLYQEMEQYVRAIPLHEKSLEILKDDLEHEILYALTLNNLVEPLQFIGEQREAIRYLKKALAIFKKHQIASFVEQASKRLATLLQLESDACAMEENRGRNLKITSESQGLDLSESYFWNVCYPMLEQEFAEYLPRMAAGLVGEGSECFGFDDKISRDHDFGPSFQIFFPKEDVPLYGQRLRDAVNALPKEYAGFGERQECIYSQGRVGVLSIETFYEKFLSTHDVPTDNRIWIQLEDIPLSTATNGRVFMDNLGKFTKIREGFLKHYPRDVQLKKIAYHLTQAAQSGQYNLHRCARRNQWVAVDYARSEFMHHYTAIIYLLNKKYCPYYKWEHEGLKHLPVLGLATHLDLTKLANLSMPEKTDYAIFAIEEMCKRLIDVLARKMLTDSQSDFLLDHVPYIMSHIQDTRLKKSNPWNERDIL